MGFFDNLRSNIKNAKQEVGLVKEVNKTLTSFVSCRVVEGANHIFTKNFVLGKTSDGSIIINHKHKVNILTCSEYIVTESVQSTTKKLAGAAVGGLLTGGTGAVVGAVVSGNNGKRVKKYGKLVAVDKNGITHEIIIEASSPKRTLINELYVS